MLEVASVETADSGHYICSATATDSSDSQYVLSSEPASATATITVSKSVHNVTITTAPYATVLLCTTVLGNILTAASSLICIVCTVQS